MKINMKLAGQPFSLISVILFFVVQPLFSQVQLESSLDKDTVMIGEPLKLFLNIDYPAGAVLDIPDESNTFTPLEILDLLLGEPELKEAQRYSKTVVFELAVYDTGKTIIPPAMIIATSYMGEESRADTVFTDLLEVYCRISKPDTLQTIHGAADLQKDDYTLIMILIIIALLIAGYLLWRWYVKRKAERLLYSNDRMIIEPPEIIAMARLAHLKKSKWLDNRKYKKWYSELNELWREYIENRYPHILAMEMTSTELITELDGIMEAADIKLSHDFIRTSDLVKFARYNPEKIDHLQYLVWVEKWINQDTATAERMLHEVEDAEQS